MTRGATDGDDDAVIVPIGAVTREATFRRLAELARRTDPVPDEVEASALTAPLIARWRSIDDELAVLVYDSDHDEAVLAHARSAESSRRLTFEGPGLRLEVEITFSRPLALVCQVVPPQPAVLEVRDGRGIVATEADSFGTFNVASLRGGPFSLRCTPSNQGCSPVATSWLRI